MKLLLHICCANCGIVPIEILRTRFHLSLFWYNPNIHSVRSLLRDSPDRELKDEAAFAASSNFKKGDLCQTSNWVYHQEEYKKRLNCVKRLAAIYYLPLIFGWSDLDRGRGQTLEIQKWFELTKGLENEPEGGKRCEICFRMRLEKTAQVATNYKSFTNIQITNNTENKFDYFATTLAISRHKNTDLINQVGQELAEKYGIKYYQFEIDKERAFQRELELSKKYNFYRQKYCGCPFSVKIFKAKLQKIL